MRDREGCTPRAAPRVTRSRLSAISRRQDSVASRRARSASDAVVSGEVPPANASSSRPLRSRALNRAETPARWAIRVLFVVVVGIDALPSAGTFRWLQVELRHRAAHWEDGADTAHPALTCRQSYRAATGDLCRICDR